MMNKKGDHPSVGEELLKGVSDLERICKVISMIVKHNDYMLEEALHIYKVSLEEYKDYEEKRNM